MSKLNKAISFFDWWKNKIHGGYISNQKFDIIMEKFLKKDK